MGLNFTFLSKIEKGRLDFAVYPSEETVLKLAEALGADQDELHLIAEKIPASIGRRVIECPDASRVLAGHDNKALDKLMSHLSVSQREASRVRPYVERHRPVPLTMGDIGNGACTLGL